MAMDIQSPKIRERVLFVCTHNSCRSQMAEGLLNARFPVRYTAQSAGIDPGIVHPMAIRVLGGIGVDTSQHTSKSIDIFLGQTFDWVVTVCRDADRSCPFFPCGRERVHRAFTDPRRVEGTEAEILAAFRETREEIDAWIRSLLGAQLGRCAAADT